MAVGMIRGFHLLLAGLFAGMGIGVMVACGAVFQATAGSAADSTTPGEVEGLLLIGRVFRFVDPLRSAIAMALIASSAALMLRSTRRFGWTRIGAAALLAGVQGYHALSLRPNLEAERAKLAAAAPATMPATVAAASPSATATDRSAAFALQRRSFALLGLQSLLAACLLVAEPFARIRTARDIARGWMQDGAAPGP